MDVSRRRAGVKATVVAGSVWESRMKLDEHKGGIKVFNGEEDNVEQRNCSNRDGAKKVVKRGQTAGISSGGKRKTWKSESFDGPIQIAKGKTNCEEQCRELSVSVDGIKKSPIQARRGRSEANKELNLSADGIDQTSIQGKKGSKELDGIVRSPIQVKKGRSEANKEVGVSVDGNEKRPSQIRKQRSDNIKEVVESNVELRKVKSDSVNVAASQSDNGKDLVVDGGVESNDPVQLKETKSEPDKLVLDESVSGTEKSPPQIEETGTEETCKEFGVCQEKIISSNEGKESIVESAPKVLQVDNPDDDDGDDHDDVVVIDGEEEFEENEEEGEVDEEIEIETEKKSFDIKEINIQEEKPKKLESNVPEQKPKKEEPNVPEQKPKKVESNVPEQKPKKVEPSIPPEEKPKQVVNKVRKVHQFNNRTAPSSSIVNKQPSPVLRRATLYQNLAKSATTITTSKPAANQYQSFPETHSKLQNLVDLVMWRDISRSAFIFGMGTFAIVSSSYAKDLNVSFISVISYLGLVYLASIFLYRSLIFRGIIDIEDDRSYVLGEDEAIWLLKLVLPYLNEFLLKIRALFSGDPATTMKMAVLLFVFARCGSSITIWKMAKLGFFGVFIVPKVCSSYSTQLTAYGKFWIRRFRDAWDSCSHKKAVALAVFTLVWNLSSMVARIWAVFMMFVAVRYYQQTVERDDWVEEDNAGADETWHGQVGGQKQGDGPTSVEVINKVKKGS